MSTSIGERLKQIRIEKGISLEEISKRTRIRLSMLQALEEDDYSDIPSQTQVRGFLKLFSDYLEIDLNSLVFELEQGSNEHQDIVHLNSIEEDKNSQINQDIDNDENTQTASLILDSDFFDPNLETKNPIKISKSIFLEIGTKLKERRELLNISVNDIENQIHIQQEYLSNLENGEFESFSSIIQAKGYLKNYAKYLNLDLDATLSKFADGLQELRQENLSGLQKETKLLKFASPYFVSFRKYFTFDLFFGFILVFSIIAFLTWGTINMINTTRGQETTQELPEIAEVLIIATVNQDMDTDSESISSTPLPDNQSTFEATPIFSPVPDLSPIQLVIATEKDAWVRLTADGEIIFEGRFLPGNAYTFSASTQIDILTGNAAALQVYFNDQFIGPLGLSAQVMQVSFNKDGLVRPTPTVTPTETSTLIPTITFQVTKNP